MVRKLTQSEKEIETIKKSWNKYLQKEMKRFQTSTGSLFNFRDDVTIITLETLEMALTRLKQEGKILFLGPAHDVEEFYRDVVEGD